MTSRISMDDVIAAVLLVLWLFTAPLILFSLERVAP